MQSHRNQSLSALRIELSITKIDSFRFKKSCTIIHTHCSRHHPACINKQNVGVLTRKLGSNDGSGMDGNRQATARQHWAGRHEAEAASPCCAQGSHSLRGRPRSSQQSATHPAAAPLEPTLLNTQLDLTNLPPPTRAAQTRQPHPHGVADTGRASSFSAGPARRRPRRRRRSVSVRPQ